MLKYTFFLGKKARPPAWCDRILFSSTRGVFSSSHRNVNTSGSLSSSLSQEMPKFAGLRLETELNQVDKRLIPEKSVGARANLLAASDGIALLEYDYIPGLFHSDHRAVFATFVMDMVDQKYHCNNSSSL